MQNVIKNNLNTAISIKRGEKVLKDQVKSLAESLLECDYQNAKIKHILMGIKTGQYTKEDGLILIESIINS